MDNFDYDRMSYGMTDEEMLSEGLVDVLDLPYDRRTDDDDDDSTYYGDLKNLDDDEDEIRF
jgi:hypothetical protein